MILSRSSRFFFWSWYLTEVIILKNSGFEARTAGDLEDLAHGDINVLGLIRAEATTIAPRASQKLIEGDVLVLKADPGSLQELIDMSGVELTGERHFDSSGLGNSEGQLVEAVVMPRSILEGQTLRRLRIHGRSRLNVLAVARKGETIRERLGEIRFHIGDLILVQGSAGEVDQGVAVIASCACSPGSIFRSCFVVAAQPPPQIRADIVIVIMFAHGILLPRC